MLKHEKGSGTDKELQNGGRQETFIRLMGNGLQP